MRPDGSRHTCHENKDSALAKLALRFDDFGWSALTQTAERNGLTVAELISASCRRCPSVDGDRPPAFIPEGGGAERTVDLDLDPAEMAALERDAERNGVPVDAIVRHRALRLLEEMESGRLLAEIVADEPGREAAS